MNDSNSQIQSLETALKRVAADFPYPATPAAPDRVLTLSARRPVPRPALAWSLAVVIVLLLSAFAVPQVRAAVVEFFQVGVLRIFFDETLNDPGTFQATPHPELADLAGRTSLAAARESTGLPLAYPAILGPPDEIYAQHIEGDLVLMVWIDHGEISATLLTLGPNAFAGKGLPQVIEETEVNGNPAAWLVGDHLLYLRSVSSGYSDFDLYQAGSVLVWEEGRLTYRLEGFEVLSQAQLVAESLTTGTE